MAPEGDEIGGAGTCADEVHGHAGSSRFRS
jgi:hypothetical protein